MLHSPQPNSPDFVEASFIFDDVDQRFPRLDGWKLLERDDGLGLRRDVPLVPQLVLPLEVRLKDLHGSDQLHVGIDPDPKNRGIAERGNHLELE